MDGVSVGRVLVVCDVRERAEARAAALVRAGVAALATGEVATACERLRREAFDAVVADLGASELSCLAVVRSAARAQPPVRVVCLIPDNSLGTRAGVSAIREAAFACLPSDAHPEQVLASVREALDARRALASIGEPAGGSRGAVRPEPHHSGGGQSWR